MKITAYSVKNYQFTLVMALMAAVIGLVTILTMPRAEDAEIRPPAYFINVVYPGTNSRDMEELVVKPIEKKLYDLDDVDKLTSTVQDGLSVTNILFKYSTDWEVKYQDVVREINSLRSDLPADLYKIEIKKMDPTEVNILQIGLASENASYKELRDQADKLKKVLEKIPELKNVEYSGFPEQIVRVDLNLSKIAKLNIPLNTVVGTLKGEAVNTPGGNININTKSYDIKTNGKYKSVDDIAGTVIYNSNGKIVLLKDIADVRFNYEDEKYITRVNGHRCVLVSACLKSGSNIAVAQKNYLPVIAGYTSSLPSNMKLIKVFDQADNVAYRLNGLGEDFLIAIVLVLITLLPLGIRPALIVMVAIPLSLSLGLVGLSYLNISLNQFSIVGLIVALSLLVDDSIVVVENIERWLHEGHSAKETAVLATKQIGMAVLGCTATLIIAFLPLVFLPGGPGEFTRGLPLAIIMSVVASLLVSLTLVPFLASRFLKPNPNKDGNFFMHGLKKAIHQTYAPLLDKALKWPKTALLIALLLFVSSFGLFKQIGFILFPDSEKPMFVIDIKPSVQSNIYETNRITKLVEDSLIHKPYIKYLTSNVGKGNPRIYYNTYQQQEKADFAELFVLLKDDTKATEKSKIIEDVRKQFSNFPWAKVEVSNFVQGPPIEAPISVRVFGDNIDSLRKLTQQVEQILLKSKGVVNVNNDLGSFKSDIKVQINREKARTLGIQTSDIDRIVRLAIAGLNVGSFTDENNDDYNIIVEAPKDKFVTLNIFRDIYVYGTSGLPVPLNQVAQLTFESSPTLINRFNKNRFAKVTAATSQGILANDVLPTIVPKLNAIKMPPGYYYKLAGQAESEDDTLNRGFITVVIATLFLFVVALILQFKTFKGLLIVLSVIPLGVVGGALILFLTGYPMSYVTIIGFIGLAGVEVKNSILLVDFTNQLRQQGMPLVAAIEKAGEIRFLPVVLTSITAICGMLPIALSSNPLISPLALVLIGGLISSTILSRIVTPVVYKLLPPQIEPEIIEK
ncbi:MAG: efflux RND transporter permease subunit [Sphingobacteriales bacterium]